MMPKYMTRIEVAISGARESPNVCARSWVESICSPPDRNENALAKVNMSRAKPMLRTVTPEKAILPLKVLNMDSRPSSEALNVYDLILSLKNHKTKSKLTISNQSLKL
jgi:hypothetical protein